MNRGRERGRNGERERGGMERGRDGEREGGREERWGERDIHVQKDKSTVTLLASILQK